MTGSSLYFKMKFAGRAGIPRGPGGLVTSLSTRPAFLFWRALCKGLQLTGCNAQEP